MPDVTEMTPFQLARGLMEGDAATFKVGYTLENAALAAQSMHELDDNARGELERDLRRAAMLEQVAQHFNLEPERSTSAAEDYADYMDGVEPIERWARVTMGSESVVYIKAAYTDENAAIHAALENVNDEVYMESPIAVVDLDTGRVHYPKWELMPWEYIESISA